MSKRTIIKSIFILFLTSFILTVNALAAFAADEILTDDLLLSAGDTFSSEESLSAEDLLTCGSEVEVEKEEVTGQDIVDYALQFVGNPYVYGGTSLTNGADCSGFVMSIFAYFDIELPHYSGAQMGYGTVVAEEDLEAGDLVFYGPGGSSHVAIYIGDGQIVHAANSRTGIVVSEITWSGTPVGYRRLL